MKVFVNKRIGDCSGGMILVAAKSKEEAHKVMLNDDDFSWIWEEEYESENWKEVEGLTCNTDMPCVIDENGYTE